ncbi:MAG: L-serine ammonia-lyase, iron-sulfur-dependent, subunit alpha [Bacillota bacterium]
MLSKEKYARYTAILKNELIPALGCTEPIAIAYAAALAAKVLTERPERLIVTCSGNIIKNVKSVTVPNSMGMSGVQAAAALGALGGDPERRLEVLALVTEEDIILAKQKLGEGFCECRLAEDAQGIYILAEAFCGPHRAAVELKRTHLGVTEIQKDGQILFAARDENENASMVPSEAPELSVREILEYADMLKLEDVMETLSRQVELNSAISSEGIHGSYGAQIGKLWLKNNEDNVANRAVAKAAAGSDARMSGCAMPVVINSGSGNQGMAVSLPVIEYARANDSTEDRLYRALAVANLVSIHIKKHIGNLSAFCGATSAACGAACGIGYLLGASYQQIAMAITNTLCNVGGMLCDGAKRSCAAKVATAVQAAILGYQMASAGCSFQPGEGLAGREIEQTIDYIGRVANSGMHRTDIEILNIMMQNESAL